MCYQLLYGTKIIIGVLLNITFFILDQQEGQGQEDDIHLYKIASIVAQKILATTQGTSSSLATNAPRTTELMPPTASTEVLNVEPELNYSVPIKNDDLNDNFDERELLHLIPKSKKNNAQILLNEFDKRGHEITWNSSGTIFIDQTAIPNSNLFIIFPFLFKVKKPPNLIGLYELIQKIDDMGLSRLIVAKKNSNLKTEPSQTKNNDDSNIPWWFIGE